MADMDNLLKVDKLPYLDMKSFKKVIVGNHQNGIAKLRGEVQLFFEWIPEEEMICFHYSYSKRFRKLRVVVRKSDTNLGIGVMYWFVCPITNRLCHKLYFVGGLLISRFAMKKARYPSQYLTTIDKVYHRNKIYEEPPYKRYGKPYYRGKLTPYGKRLIRYNERLEATEEALDEMYIPKLLKMQR